MKISAPSRTGGVESSGVADALAVDEDVDVRPHLAELGHDAVADARDIAPTAATARPETEPAAPSTRTSPRFPASSRSGPGITNVKRHQLRSRTAVFTATTGGSPSSSSDQLSPSSAEPNNFPLRVPK